MNPAPSHVTYLYPDGYLQAIIPFWSVDGEEVVAGWTVAGTQIMYWATETGEDPRSLPLDGRFTRPLTTAPRTWSGTMLRMFVPDQWFQVLHFFTESGEFSHWYVDFETPKLPDGHGGWATCDLELDLIIHSDGAAEWKDQDELSAALKAGHLPSALADQVVPIAERIQRDPARFIGSLPDWRTLPGPQDLSALSLPEPAAWRHLVRPTHEEIRCGGGRTSTGL